MKIMFNKAMGLEDSVFDGSKTCTRRVISNNILATIYREFDDGCAVSIPCNELIKSKAPYKVGEVVAIAQSYKDIYECNHDPEYFSTHSQLAGWNNKMFVRADEMSHHIKIESVGIQHLQNITDEDCIREGIKVITAGGCVKGYTFQGCRKTFGTPRKAFAALIDKTSGRGTWESNPLVWTYYFSLYD